MTFFKPLPYNRLRYRNGNEPRFEVSHMWKRLRGNWDARNKTESIQVLLCQRVALYFHLRGHAEIDFGTTHALGAHEKQTRVVPLGKVKRNTSLLLRQAALDFRKHKGARS